LLTINVYPSPSNVAVIVVVAVSVTVHVPAPLHPPPLQPVNVDPTADAAVRVTTVPLPYVAEQLAPQLIPVGALVTVPLPAPIFSTARPYVCATVAQAELE